MQRPKWSHRASCKSQFFGVVLMQVSHNSTFRNLFLIYINNLVFEYKTIWMFQGEMSYQHPYLPFNAQGITLRCYVQKILCYFLGVSTSSMFWEDSRYPVIFFRLCIAVDSVLWPDHTFPQLWDWNPVDGDSVHLIYVFSKCMKHIIIDRLSFFSPLYIIMHDILVG